MRFGRVEGIVLPVDDGATPRLRLIVHLESGRGFEVVRDETLAPLRPIVTDDDLRWHAEQWTQETIGVDLALQGWEPIGAGDEPTPEPGAAARSRSYAVRQL